MRISYSPAQKIEAVALARVVGAEAAADEMALDPRTVRKWQAEAGVPPSLDVEGGTWQALHDLAVAKTTSAVASGKLPVRTVAIIAGIAARNLRIGRAAALLEPEPEPSQTPPGDAARDRLRAYVDALPDAERIQARDYLRCLLDAEIARRHLDEPGAVSIPDTRSLAEQDAAGAEAWDSLAGRLRDDWPAVVAYLEERDVRQAARERQRKVATAWLSDEAADLLHAAEAALALEEEGARA